MMRVYLGYDVPEDWEGSTETFVSLLVFEARNLVHTPTAYYVEEE